MPFGRDARTQTHEFVHVAKSPHEEVLGDDRDPVGDAQHRGDKWLVVGRHPGIRQGRHVTSRQALGSRDEDPLAAFVNAPAHCFDLSKQHLHVFGPRVKDAHLAARDEP